MADKFLNLSGLNAIRTWILGKLGGKQDTLVSGTNLKTINNTSLLGSGDLPVTDIVVAWFNYTGVTVVKNAIENNKVIILQFPNQLYHVCIYSSITTTSSGWTCTLYYIQGSVLYKVSVTNNGSWLNPESIGVISMPDNSMSDSSLNTVQNKIIKAYVDGKIPTVDQTYDNTSTNAQSGTAVAEAVLDEREKRENGDDALEAMITGLANPNQSIDINAQGQLEVGGRLGQHPGGGGVFYPTNIEPTGVGASSFLMTDGAKNIAISQRTFAIMAGASITCKSAAAGSTTYRVSNTQANRFALAAVRGGRAALNQTDAIENGTAAIVSIKYANGNDLNIPYFGANESDNDIIITLERSINPSAATTQLRVYGRNNNSDNILVGQGVGANGGKVISLGQSTYAGGNQNVAIGNSAYVSGNNSVGLGHTHLVNKQYCLAAGQGHDFTNASNGTTAVGTWSELSSTTKFAVGAGTAFDSRSNIFEVRSNSGQTEMIVKSPNGTKYKLAVDDSGNLTATAV